MSTPIVSGAFAEVLRQNRARFNARFEAARKAAPTLDGAAFLSHLSTRVAPLVETVYEHEPQRAAATASALYEISLQHFAKNLLGDAPRSVLIPLAWERLFPTRTRLLAHSPKQVLGGACNALLQIENTPGTRGREWIAEMSTLALHRDDGDDFLRAGQIVAWRCGLAHLRAGALHTARALGQKNEPLARAALGAGNTSDALESLVTSFETSVWWTPQEKQNNGAAPRIRKAIGAFAGFAKDGKAGALFKQPPRVAWHNGNFFAADEESVWLFFADAFGASFHRVGALLEFSGDPRAPSFSSAPVERVAIEQLQSPSSTARGASTLAVTLPHSHAIFLVA